MKLSGCWLPIPLCHNGLREFVGNTKAYYQMPNGKFDYRGHCEKCKGLNSGIFYKYECQISHSAIPTFAPLHLRVTTVETLECWFLTSLNTSKNIWEHVHLRDQQDHHIFWSSRRVVHDVNRMRYAWRQQEQPSGLICLITHRVFRKYSHL
jgi:hypothetical protein